MAELPRYFNSNHFVISDDGWVAARAPSRLFVFDRAGELMVEHDIGFIHDARFAPGPQYVAQGNRLPMSPMPRSWPSIAQACD